MTVTLTTNGGNTTLTIAYTAPTAKITAVLEDAVHYLYDHGFGDHSEGQTWETQTLTDKRDLLDVALKAHLKNLATAYYVAAQTEAERQTSQTEAEANYGI